MKRFFVYETDGRAPRSCGEPVTRKAALGDDGVRWLFLLSRVGHSYRVQIRYVPTDHINISTGIVKVQKDFPCRNTSACSAANALDEAQRYIDVAAQALLRRQ